MFAVSDPDLFVAQIAIGGLVLAGFWRVIVWVRNAPVRPNPWGAEFEQKMQDPDTPETCHHCSTPQPPGAWFCEHCGRVINSYNNWTPYVYSFSDGSVFRSNESGRLRVRWIIVVGYLLLISIKTGIIISPLFCILFFLNQRRIKQEMANASNSMTNPSSPDVSDSPTVP
jgi:hypothetical protein